MQRLVEATDEARNVKLVHHQRSVIRSHNSGKDDSEQVPPSRLRSAGQRKEMPPVKSASQLKSMDRINNSTKPFRVDRFIYESELDRTIRLEKRRMHELRKRLKASNASKKKSNTETPKLRQCKSPSATTSAIPRRDTQRLGPPFSLNGQSNGARKLQHNS